MSDEAKIYEEITIRIRKKVSDLNELMEELDDTVKDLYDQNNLEEDTASRVANKRAIDFSNNLVSAMRSTMGLVTEISRDCLELHKRIGKRVNEIEHDIKPAINAKTTASGMFTASKWVTGVMAAMLAIAGLLNWVFKHIKIV